MNWFTPRVQTLKQEQIDLTHEYKYTNNCKLI